MSMLSKRTGEHYKSHQAIIRGFVEPWRPQITGRLEYGNLKAIITLPEKFLDSEGKFQSRCGKLI